MKKVTLLWIIAALLFAVSSVASAQTIELSFNSSKHISLNQNIAQIFVGTKSIVKVAQPTDALNEFVITANEKTGSTTIFVWTVDGAKYEYTVNVVDDKIAEVGVIEREIGLPNVRVRKIGGKILLQGTVENDAEYEHVMKIVSLFVEGAKVVRSSAFDLKTGEFISETREEGVGNVIDELKILHPRVLSAEEILENLQKQEIENAIGLPNVHVRKIGKNLLLEGRVENNAERKRAVEIASLFAEDGKVIDQLELLHAATSLEEQIDEAIGLRSVYVQQIGENILLTGTVVDEKERASVVAAAETFGAKVIDRLEIDLTREIVQVIGLPDVRVEKIGNKILLQGTVESDAERKRVLEIAGQTVGADNYVDGLKILPVEEKIEQAISLPDVHVKIVDGRILLTGTVKNQYERNQVLQIARLYMNGDSGDSLSYGSNLAIDGSSSGSLIDLLQMSNPTQIRLEAQIISINPSDSKNLGVLYGTSSTSGDTRTPAAPGIFYFGEGNYRGSGSRFRSNPWSWLMERHANINISIDALISNTKAKILSRPSITTMSGEEAKIQIGGEIPYQSYSSSGIPSTEFKDYGIMLNFKPIVDAQNRVVTSISVEVSNLSGESVDGQPIIATRSANTVVTLNSGSTMVIGGLMDSSERKVVRKIPLLGDIPIIGEFFKYSSKTRDKQEMIILVTPYIVEDTSRAGMSNEMRDYYREGQRERNSLNDVDLNSPPPEIKPRERESQNQSNQSKSAVIFGDAF